MLRPRNMLILLVLLPGRAGRCHRSQRSAAGLAIPERKASAWQFEREDSWALKFENDDFSALQFEDDGRPWYCKTEDSAVARAKSNPGGEFNQASPSFGGIAAAITKQVDCG